jgi:hypothetical protein
MSRLTDSVLAKGKAYGGHSAALDLKLGGQSGHTSAIGRVGADGKNYDEWISNQAHVKQNIIPVVLKYPTAFDYFTDKAMMISAYNAIMTMHPETITGFQSGLTVDFDEHAIGGAGEMQEEFTKVSRARTAINMTFKEKAGKSIQKYIDLVIRHLYSDPDMEKPLISNALNTDAKFGGLYTPDYYTGTHLYIEPDVTQQNVVDAWLCTNVMFKSNGERTAKRDIHSARETMDLSIDLTSITMNSDSVLKLAQTVLSGLNVLHANPDDAVLPQIITEPGLGNQHAGLSSTDFNAVPNVAGSQVPNNAASAAASQSTQAVTA